MPLPRGPVVGTCGFSYLEWRGRFYPPEQPQSEWLRFYARVFEAVELDGTFYRPPEREVVAAWAAALPERFALSAKAPKAITHEARLEGEAAVAMLRVFARALEPLGDRLLAVVLQLPPSLSAAEGRVRLARLLGTRPAGLPVVVEVRHRSWDQPWLADLLEDGDAGLVLADRPGERPWPASSGGPVRYLRLLGTRQGTPVIGRPVHDRAADLDRWAALLGAGGASAGGPSAGGPGPAAAAGPGPTGRPAAAFASERAGTSMPGASAAAPGPSAAAGAGPSAAGAGSATRPAAAFANNRFEGAAFLTAAALRRRLGQPAVDPRELWPAPPLPGFDV